MRNEEPAKVMEEALAALGRLRAYSVFEKRNLRYLENLLDRDLVIEIGQRQLEGDPLSLKQAFLLGMGSIATVQRRLRRLRRLGVIAQRRNAADRRVAELLLTPKVLKVFALYAELMRAEGGERDGMIAVHPR